MLRMLACATLAAALVVVPRAADDQQAARLVVTVVLVDASGTTTPVPRHALLVSGNPPSAPPRQIVTSADGTASLNLRPGSYIVESDEPVAFRGQAYLWIQAVDVVAGRDTVLELTGDNAIVEPITASTRSATTDGTASADIAPSALLLRWQDSVVALWTPTAHASGFVIDPRGLIATSQRVVGTATSVEVQITPTLKVAGSVLVADPARDVAVVRVHPAAVASLSVVPLGCGQPATPLEDGQELLTIGVPLRGSRDLSFGTARRATADAITADFSLGRLSPGGPVFAADGDVVGISSIAANDARPGGELPVVAIDDACVVVQSVEDAMLDVPPPDGTRLPVEPATAIPADVLAEAVAQRAGSLNPYPMSSSDFDITFITPVQLYNGLHTGSRPAMDFSNWSRYVRDVPAVLFVRVTPKQSESFWMKLARGAAMTQGAALPPITHFKSGFARLRAFCGEAEITPLHPFRLELRLSETEAIHEGLYVFEPDAFDPDCDRVSLTLYSENEPEKGDTREVDPAVLRRIWDDFERYR